MRLPDLIHPNPDSSARHPQPPFDRLLPPNPEPPSRPTIPGPTCGTLPPVLPRVLGSLGHLGRLGR